MDNNPPAQTQDTKTLTPSFELFKPSLNAIKFNLKTVLLISLVLPLYFMIVGLLSGLYMTTSDGSFVSGGIMILILLVAISIVLSLIFAPATIYLQIQSVKGNQTSFSQAITSGRQYMWRFFALSIIVGLTIFCGLLLFVVPGIIFMRRYLLAGYYMIDQNLGVNEAMRISAQQSKSYSGSIYGIIGVNIVLAIASGFLGIIPILGAIAGVLIQFTYSFAPAVRYLEIKNATPANPQQPATPSTTPTPATT